MEKYDEFVERLWDDSTKLVEHAIRYKLYYYIFGVWCVSCYKKIKPIIYNNRSKGYFLC